jgi:hypothetical protein
LLAASKGGHFMLTRLFVGFVIIAATLLVAPMTASAFDESKYPEFQGQWKRKLGTINSWDETKRPGHPQNPPLTPEYRQRWEASMTDQAAGGQGLDTRVTCISNGMPRMMTILRQLEIFIRPEITLIVFENNLPRRIYTDGRNFTAKDNLPSYNGYSIGKWIDENGDGKFDVLEVETRNFKGPRNYEPSGIPLHDDNESVILERMYLDKNNPDTLVNEITTVDHALTRPWKVVKNYRREKNVEWYEDLCTENNNHVMIGKENYFMSADGYLMPAKKGQQPPDLRYFNTQGN